MNPEKPGALHLATALVDGLVARGMAGVVMSPGSRNAPLVQAVTRLGIEQAVALDERAAGHHALGMAWALRRPVAVCCTSGTAALNHGPALAEAHRSGLPLISITADRPKGAHGEWQSQTLVQEGVHAAHVRASFTWEPGTSEEAEALLDAMADALRGGPIHVNCPFDEPLYPISDAPTTGTTDRDEIGPAGLSVPTDGDRRAAWENELNAAMERGDRIMLLGGTQWRPLSAEALKIWARHALLVGDSTSGMALEGVPVLTACDRWFGAWSNSGASWDDYRPDLIVTFGTPLLSRRLKAQLADGVMRHVHLDPAGSAPNAFGIPCRNVALNPATALDLGADLLKGAPAAADRPAWTAPWSTLEATLSGAHGGALDAAPWSDLMAHHILHGALPEGWDLHLGNSTPVRYAQLFPEGHGYHPWSNRGVAGIDGCSSTAVGAALAGRDTTLITGELGFLYDANAFHIHPLPANLRIAVVHNGGGGIFRWLDGPERTGLVESHFEWRHDMELRPLCDLHGLIHERVSDATALRDALDLWWQPSDAPKVLEIATPSESSAAAYKAYMQAVRP